MLVLFCPAQLEYFWGLVYDPLQLFRHDAAEWTS